MNKPDVAIKIDAIETRLSHSDELGGCIHGAKYCRGYGVRGRFQENDKRREILGGFEPIDKRRVALATLQTMHEAGVSRARPDSQRFY